MHGGTPPARRLSPPGATRCVSRPMPAVAQPIVPRSATAGRYAVFSLGVRDRAPGAGSAPDRSARCADLCGHPRQNTANAPPGRAERPDPCRSPHPPPHDQSAPCGGSRHPPAPGPAHTCCVAGGPSRECGPADSASRCPSSSGGQVEAAVEQRDATASAQRGEHAHLGVVHLAQATIPLPRHTGGSAPLLGKGAFIENQGRVLSTEQGIGLTGDFPAQPFPVHRRFGQQVVQGL